MRGSTTTSQPDISTALTRAALTALSIYLLATTPLLIRGSLAAGTWTPIPLHVIALAVSVVGARGQVIPLSLRDWTPLALGPFLYIELRWIIAGAGRPHADRAVAAWDERVFGFAPSHDLASMWHWQPLSELLHLCYVSYYALVYVPPALLWLKGRRHAFVSTSFALIAMFGICFVTWIAFPVDGPRFLHGPAAAPDGPIRSIVVRILDAGSSRGTAFPSAHVAAALVAAWCALRFQRALGWVIAVLSAGLAIGAVYGGYHYGVDVLAGALVALAAISIASAIENSMRTSAPARTGNSERVA